MANLVFILGAGASVASGCPLMRDFFDKARRLSDLNLLGEYDKDYQIVNQFREHLNTQQYRTRVDINNLESVFNTIELGQFLGRVGEYNSDDLAQLRQSYVRLIVGVIDTLQQYSYKQEYLPHGQSGSHSVLRITPPSPYGDFATFAKRVLHSQVKHDVSVITLNYDLGLEAGLISMGVDFHYAGIQEPQSDHSVRVYKPHGSINWFTVSGKITPVVDPFAQTVQATVGKTVANYSSIPPMPKLSAVSSIRKHFAGSPSPEPIIVPPTENKRDYQANMKTIWHQLSETLSKSTNIYVCGYSLPDTDQFFARFLSVSCLAGPTLRHFGVYDIHAGVGARFKNLLSVSAGEKMAMIQKDFSASIAEWSDNFSRTEECL